MRYISKTTLALWSFILLVLLTSGWFFLDSREYNHRRYIEQTLEGISRLKVSSIETWRDSRLRDAEMLSLNPVLRDAVLKLQKDQDLGSDQHTALIKAVRQQMLPLQLAYEYKNIRIIDRNNTYLVSLFDCCGNKEASSFRHVLERAWIDRAPVLSDVYLDFDDAPVMDVIVPLFLDEDAESLGLALNLVIDPRLDFYPSLQEIPIPSDSYEALLVRQEANQIRFITPLRHLAVAPLTNVLPMDSPELPAAIGLKGREGVVAGRDYRNEPVLAISSHVRDTPWVLIVKMDEAEALQVQRRKTRLAAVGIAILGVAVLALAFLSKTQADLSQSEDLQKAQAAVLAQETRLASVLRAAPIGIAITREHNLTEINEAFCSQFEYDHDELIGRSVRQLFPTNEAYEEVVPYVDEAIGAGERYTCEARLVRHGASEFDALVSVAAIDDIGNHGDVCFTVMDISRLKEQEAKLSMRSAELERSNADLTTFAYVASHDLRSPLRGINQLSDWIRQDIPETVSSDVKGYLDLMSSRIHRMEALLDDLLEYSRVGRIEGDVEEVSIEKICRENFDLMQPPTDFQLKIQDNLPVFVTLSTPIELIFRNLISNAIKHRSSDDGWVEIRSSELGDMYRFVVADNGPGIAPVFHERVFALFQTLRPRDEVEGSGMGLSIIRRVLETYGGRINVVSDGVQGTEFVFTWPKEGKLRRMLNAR